MKLILITFSLLLSFTLIANENSTKVTYLKLEEVPSKNDLSKAIDSLKTALTKKMNSVEYKKLVEVAKSSLKTKNTKRKINAAIVVDGVNLADYDNFIQDGKSFCYNGKSRVAFEVIKALEDEIWIYDEFVIHNLYLDGETIGMEVIDERSYNDSGASESEIDEFITLFLFDQC